MLIITINTRKKWHNQVLARFYQKIIYLTNSKKKNLFSSNLEYPYMILENNNFFFFFV